MGAVEDAAALSGVSFGDHGHCRYFAEIKSELASVSGGSARRRIARQPDLHGGVPDFQLLFSGATLLEESDEKLAYHLCFHFWSRYYRLHAGTVARCIDGSGCGYYRVCVLYCLVYNQ